MIYYFSGTGNTRHVAQALAQRLEDKTIPVNWETAPSLSHDERDTLGIVLPVYAWGPPLVIEHFLQEMPWLIMGKQPYIYVVLTCGDDVGLTDRVVKRALKKKGLKVSAVFSVQMRNTYVCLPGFDIDKPETERQKMERADRRIEQIAAYIEKRVSPHPPLLTPGNMPWLKTYILRPLFNRWLISDSHFHIDAEKCIRCGQCVRTCQLDNMRMPAAPEVPQWTGRCTHCLACYHVCPQHAIEYGFFTRGKGQVKING